ARDPAVRPAETRLDVAPAGGGHDLLEEGEQAAVPLAEGLGVEGDAPDPWRGLDPALDLVGARARVLEPPAPGQPDQQRAGVRLLEGHAAFRDSRGPRPAGATAIPHGVTGSPASRRYGISAR